MGKKAVAKNRRRRARENATVDAVLDGAALAAANERAIGVVVNEKAPDAAIFTIDRAGVSKEDFDQDMRLKTKAALRERRLARPFGVDTALENKSRKPAVAINVPGRKKRRKVAAVELGLLEKRNFKRTSAKSTKRKGPGLNQDIWATPLAVEVSKSKSVMRKRIEEKYNARFRAATRVLMPGDGLSVNPAFEAHQDALGEAVADLMDKQFEVELIKKKIGVDKEARVAFAEEERRAADAMEEDGKNEEDSKDGEENGEEEKDVTKAMPERKSRTDRNRERRRRESDANRVRKIARYRMREDMENLEKIAEEAIREADKINGDTKKRELEMNPPVAPGKDAPLMKEVAKEKVRTEAMVMTVPLSDDLAPSMRGMAMPVGNSIIKDRFLSFERRGFVEPTGVLKKEAKQAEQERRAHLLRDKKRKNRRGSRSNISYWRQGGKKKRRA